MEFCKRLYNTTNATMRELESGVPNITRQQYLQMCVRARKGIPSDVNMFIIIPYVVIFLLSMAGNTLVILTLVRHKKMRTVTNMFLLNLAISDLLLALFCMPFTLVPLLMQEFIFGAVVCVLVRYAQAVSVSVSCATLVAISLERFYAICQPLRSRRWQTVKHSRKAILGIWLSSAAIMVPIAVFSKEMELNNGARACRELWPSGVWEPLYTMILDAVLLVVPLFLMAFSYGRISKDLWSEVSLSIGSDPRSPLSEYDSRTTGKDAQNGYSSPPNQSPRLSHRHIAPTSPTEPTHGKFQLRVIQPAHSFRLLANKKRVVKMLFVVVLEYFICWTPLNVLNSWTVFDYQSARDHFTPLSKTIILLVAYMSSCVHPITYCFMNKRFRQSFVDAFRCCFRKKTSTCTFYSEASHFNGVSDVNSTRSPPVQFKITWKRRT